jgi:hypothetical protein
MEPDATVGFAGFSKDVRSFAWVVPTPQVPDVNKLHIISVGGVHSKPVFVDTADGRAKGKALLVEGGYTSVKEPAPPDVTLEASLTATPPTLTLVRGTATRRLSGCTPTDRRGSQAYQTILS